jgi:hypothetical protein
MRGPGGGGYITNGLTHISDEMGYTVHAVARCE